MKRPLSSLRILPLITCLLGACLGPACLGAELVKTTHGLVEGLTVDPFPIHSFRGIPYAAAPVGSLRWKAPQPASNWTGVRKATDFGPSAMQRVHGDFLPWTTEYLVTGAVSEDCLTLNVWTPKTDTKAGLPVLVYIHGGAFTEGSGSIPLYAGTELARQGIVVVTINYRLGVFGFLAHPELNAESPGQASGNYGLQDQIAALRWVRDNIRQFGGDPAQVTIWGQSAGAMSVGALLVSDQARGLFRAAVASSGLGLVNITMPELAGASAAGREQTKGRPLAELRALPASELLALGGGRPIIDGQVLTQSPTAAVLAGKDAPVPVMTGYMGNDGLMGLPPLQTAEDYRRHAGTVFGPLAGEYLELYPIRSDSQIREALLAAAQDRERVSQLLWARERLAHHGAHTYTYFFTRAIPWPAHPEFGAFHSGELPYFFSNLAALDRPWTAEDREVCRLVSGYLVQFVKTGNPNAEGFPAWDAVSSQDELTQRIDAKTGPMPVGEEARTRFWIRILQSSVASSLPVF